MTTNINNVQFKPLEIDAKPLNEAQQVIQHMYNMGADTRTQQSWEDLQGIYSACAHALAGAPGEINTTFRIPGIFNFIDKVADVRTAMKTLASDIRVLAEELTMINKTHVGKTGLITTPEDTQLSIGVFEQYFNFQQKFNGIILPSVMLLAEEAGKAVNKMQQAIDKANELNPDVVTDVAPKEA